eukprot:5802350-Pleurochrysis_carterae.AAC.1
MGVRPRNNETSRSSGEERSRETERSREQVERGEQGARERVSRGIGLEKLRAHGRTRTRARRAQRLLSAQHWCRCGDEGAARPEQSPVNHARRPRVSSRDLDRTSSSVRTSSSPINSAILLASSVV